MASVLQIPTDPTLRRIHQIQAITIVWMIVEACVSLWAAWMARSPALLAFGGDSAIELLSAGVVLWLSGAIAASGCGATSRPNRRSAALHCCGMRFRSLRGLTAGISRPSAYLPRTDNSGGRSADHAVACSSEAPVVSDD